MAEDTTTTPGARPPLEADVRAEVDRLGPELIARAKRAICRCQGMKVPALHLILVTRVDARGIPRRHGTFCQGLRKVSQKLQPLLERGLLAKSAGCREIGVIRGGASQVIAAAVFYSFRQPTHDRTEHQCLAALPAKVGRGGSEKRFESCSLRRFLVAQSERARW